MAACGARVYLRVAAHTVPSVFYKDQPGRAEMSVTLTAHTPDGARHAFAEREGVAAVLLYEGGERVAVQSILSFAHPHPVFERDASECAAHFIVTEVSKRHQSRRFVVRFFLSNEPPFADTPPFTVRSKDPASLRPAKRARPPDDDSCACGCCRKWRAAA